MVWVHQNDNSEIIFQVHPHRTFVFLFKKSQFSTNTEKFSMYQYTFFTVEEAGMLLKFMRVFYVCIHCVQRTVKGWQCYKVNHADLGNARMKKV